MKTDVRATLPTLHNLLFLGPYLAMLTRSTSLPPQLFNHCRTVFCATPNLPQLAVLGSLLSNADLLDVTATTVLQPLLDVLSHYTKFPLSKMDSTTSSYRPTHCFNLPTFGGCEDSRDIVFCTEQSRQYALNLPPAVDCRD